MKTPITQDEEGNYVVQFLDIEEAFTEGADLEEALFNASEVLSLCLEQRIIDKKEIPEPSKKGEKSYMIVSETGI